MKLHFLSASDTELSSRDLSLLEGVKKNLLQTPDFTEVSDPESADAILLQEETSFKEWRYVQRLVADPLVGRYPHKIMTINTDDSAAGLLRGIYTSLARHRFDPLLHRSVPFASFPNEAIYLRREQSNPAPNYLASWRGNPQSNPLRSKLIQTFAGNPRFRIEATDSWLNHDPAEKEHYVDLLLSAKFALCPAGWAPVTFRIYESMALGICPVLLADDYVPPLGPDWPSFSLQIPEKKVSQIESLLRERESEAPERGRLARLAWEKFFSPEHVSRFYANALAECIHAPGKRSRETELQRWRSLKMYWSNRWTLPQRLQSKLKRLSRG
jgi:hypothetical protein